MSIIERLRKGVQQSLRQATIAGYKYSRIGRIRFEIVAVKKEIEELLIELGGRVYDHAAHAESREIKLDISSSQKIARIRELEKELSALKQKLKDKDQNNGKEGDDLK